MSPLPTGTGQEMVGEAVAGLPGQALPPRPVRAAANDAKSLPGYPDRGEHAHEGKPGMETVIPWASEGAPVSWPDSLREGGVNYGGCP